MHRPILVNELLLSDKLFEHCAEIDEAARNRMELIMPELAKRNGVTEQLKAENLMEWVRQMNACKAQAEERLTNKFGFNIANFTQALLFGLLHGLMFYVLVGAVKTILIITLTGAIAWFMGCINEKNSNGSIIPSWIIHTVSNSFSGICAAFSII